VQARPPASEAWEGRGVRLGGSGACSAPSVCAHLVNEAPVLVAPLVQPRGGAQAGGAGAEDEDIHLQERKSRGASNTRDVGQHAHGAPSEEGASPWVLVRRRSKALRIDRKGAHKMVAAAVHHPSGGPARGATASVAMDVPCDTAQEGGDVAGGKSGLANSAPATAWQETLEKATKAVVVLKTTGTRCFDTDTAGSSYATGASVSFFSVRASRVLPCCPDFRHVARTRGQALWWIKAAGWCSRTGTW
jgi:hypothetical protein